VPIAQASEIVLRPVLETLKGGILVEVSKPDAHAWKLIGAKAEELNMKRLRKETLDWTSVCVRSCRSTVRASPDPTDA